MRVNVNQKDAEEQAQEALEVYLDNYEHIFVLHLKVEGSKRIYELRSFIIFCRWWLYS